MEAYLAWDEIATNPAAYMKLLQRVKSVKATTRFALPSLVLLAMPPAPHVGPRLGTQDVY